MKRRGKEKDRLSLLEDRVSVLETLLDRIGTLTCNYMGSKSGSASESESDCESCNQIRGLVCARCEDTIPGWEYIAKDMDCKGRCIECGKIKKTCRLAEFRK